MAQKLRSVYQLSSGPLLSLNQFMSDYSRIFSKGPLAPSSLSIKYPISFDAKETLIEVPQEKQGAQHLHREPIQSQQQQQQQQQIQNPKQQVQLKQIQQPFKLSSLSTDLDGSNNLGPFSTNEMDQLWSNNQLTDQTRIAFETLDKFVKCERIYKLAEQNLQQLKKLEEEKRIKQEQELLEQQRILEQKAREEEQERQRKQEELLAKKRQQEEEDRLLNEQYEKRINVVNKFGIQNLWGKDGNTNTKVTITQSQKKQTKNKNLNLSYQGDIQSSEKEEIQKIMEKYSKDKQQQPSIKASSVVNSQQNFGVISSTSQEERPGTNVDQFVQQLQKIVQAEIVEEIKPIKQEIIIKQQQTKDSEQKNIEQIKKIQQVQNEQTQKTNKKQKKPEVPATKIEKVKNNEQQVKITNESVQKVVEQIKFNESEIESRITEDDWVEVQNPQTGKKKSKGTQNVQNVPGLVQQKQQPQKQQQQQQYQQPKSQQQQQVSLNENSGINVEQDDWIEVDIKKTNKKK